MHQQPIGSNLYLLAAIAVFLKACSLHNPNGFTRSTIDKRKSFDSIVQISFNDKDVVKEYYKKSSIIKLKIQDKIKANVYYRDYYGLRELGVDLFANHCASCHLWYPDFKNIRNYGSLDSFSYKQLFKSDFRHKAINLSDLELVAIGSYLHILDSK